MGAGGWVGGWKEQRRAMQPDVVSCAAARHSIKDSLRMRHSLQPINDDGFT